MKHQRLFDNEEAVVSRISFRIANTSEQDKHSVKSIIFTMTAVIMVFVFVCVFMPPLLMIIGHGIYHLQISPSVHLNESSCESTCTLTLVESIPDNLTYPGEAPSHMRTYDAWSQIIDSATTSIDIASFYWTLLGEDVYKDPSDWQGESTLKKLQSAAKERGVKMRIVQNDTDEAPANKDLQLLVDAGAEVRYLKMSRFFGAGVLHTKLLLVDGRHMYVGSANMDWRSLTQVKELGALIGNCSCLAADAMKLFEVYWLMAQPDSHIPAKWPQQLFTVYNRTSPMKLTINATSSLVYLSSSPEKFCPEGRTDDLTAILDIISKARKYVYIAVMDYSPTVMYSHPRRYWPDIDNALRKVSMEHGVHVRIMASQWNHTLPAMLKYLRSLSDISGAMRANIKTKLFVVPAYTKAQTEIPFARVNHNKYMVTDNTAYIGTSNWSGDYFVATAGVGLIVNDTAGEGENGKGLVRKQLADIFLRDWNSQYAKPLHEFSAERNAD